MYLSHLHCTQHAPGLNVEDGDSYVLMMKSITMQRRPNSSTPLNLDVDRQARRGVDLDRPPVRQRGRRRRAAARGGRDDPLARQRVGVRDDLPRRRVELNLTHKRSASRRQTFLLKKAQVKPNGGRLNDDAAMASSRRVRARQNEASNSG